MTINNVSYQEDTLLDPGKRARGILQELDGLLLHRDNEHLIQSRAANVISGAINLINHIKECYDPTIADELERRLLNSIRTQDPEKFNRGIRRLKNNENK